MSVFVCFAVVAVCYRKTNLRKYERDCNKPISKMYPAAGNHSSQEDYLHETATIQEFSRADSQRVLFRPSNHMGSGGPSHYQEQLQRRGVGSSNEEEIHSVEDDTVSFIDLKHNNLKIPEKKGILKKPDYGMMMTGDGKNSWGDGAQSDELMTQAELNMSQIISGGPSDVERTLKTLNGYHEDIIKALRNAASRKDTTTPSGSTCTLSDELLRRSLQQCAESYSKYERSGSQEKVVIEHEDEDEDEVPPCGPLRIRNLEDLIRQLEHHSRHMSPSGSEDIRMSETEADRHYRQESSSACSESSHQSHGGRDQRFVYGRYRQPSGRMPYPHPHQHPHSLHQAEEDSIYESADHERGMPCGDTPDSESSATASPVGQ
ncbi:unnamed protein product [Brassicogethes aeneus]|uniref:Uncharacterized protein n=1 Tax=Brassicogethes aeneus TaxID=1431903 RepID=A0A9P0B7M2_BRAAE|nr:unnamed protein product [Brassicogethes aeneus]